VVAPGAVAEVQGGAPIARSEFDHWLTVMSLAESSADVPRIGSRRFCRLRDDVMDFLLSAQWIELEAAERGITVPSSEIQRRFESARRAPYLAMAAYRRFQHRSALTQADMLFRLRITLLSQRLNAALLPGLKGAAKDRALAQFARAFTRKWTARTRCAAGFVTILCGQGPPPLVAVAG
jgi:hypothetical protein